MILHLLNFFMSDILICTMRRHHLSMPSSTCALRAALSYRNTQRLDCRLQSFPPGLHSTCFASIQSGLKCNVSLCLENSIAFASATSLQYVLHVSIRGFSHPNRRLRVRLVYMPPPFSLPRLHRWINNVAAMFQIAATFVTVIVALSLASSWSNPDFFWTPNYNFAAGGGGQSPIFAVMTGLLFSLFAMSGFDSGSQSSEETQNAAVSAPRGALLVMIFPIFESKTRARCVDSHMSDTILTEFSNHLHFFIFRNRARLHHLGHRRFLIHSWAALRLE